MLILGIKPAVIERIGSDKIMSSINQYFNSSVSPFESRENNHSSNSDSDNDLHKSGDGNSSNGNGVKLFDSSDGSEKDGNDDNSSSGGSEKDGNDYNSSNAVKLFDSSDGSEKDGNDDNSSIVSLCSENAISTIKELWKNIYQNDLKMKSLLDRFVLDEDTFEKNSEFVKTLFEFFLGEAEENLFNAEYFQKIKGDWTDVKKDETKILRSGIFNSFDQQFTHSSNSYTGYWLYFLCYLAYAITEKYESVDEFKLKLIGSHYFVEGELYDNIFYVLEQSGNDFKAQCEFFVNAIFLK